MLRFIVAMFLALNVQSALASDWGCQTLLCLSNPNGPEDVAECVDPIQKLWKHLWEEGEMPGCDLAGGDKGGGAVPSIGVEKSYDDDDDLEWVKVSVDGKLVKTLSR